MASTEPSERQVLKARMREQRQREAEAYSDDLCSRFAGQRFSVIYADPPWRFETYSDKGRDRGAENHYATMTTEQIMALDVPAICAKDAALYLWVYRPMLPDALKVMEAWGFTYKSDFMWYKPTIGLGYYNRGQHEQLFIGTRGKIRAPAPGVRRPSVLSAPKRGHSRKPDEFHEVLEQYYPDLPRIELFARHARPGWQAWGLEAPREAA